MDLSRGHRAVAGELRDAFDRVLASGAFTLGEEVEAFEAEFAEYCRVDHCIGVNSGTAALTLSLLALGIGPGDEVIIPAHTYVATAFAVCHSGATPVFCDVERETGLIDAASAASVISARTAAIIPVHLYGQMADMDAVGRLARRHRLMVVEDAAQAHGAAQRGRRAGSIGDVAGFSFYPSKNLGALGDGGAICTNDDLLAGRARRLRNLGQARKGEHVDAGMNERLDGLQAALLAVKLRGLDAANAKRRALAEHYRALLPTSWTAVERDGNDSVHHLFPVRVPGRDEFRARLRERGIQTGVHYAPAVHRQPPFAGTSRAGLEESEGWAAEVVTLPMFAELSAAEVERVAATAVEAFEELAA